MSIKEKFGRLWGKLRKKNNRPTPKSADSELSAEEVVEEEIFPEGKRTVKRTKKNCGCATGSSKPASKRTRPANPDYEMIDPDCNTCDTGKS